MERCNVALVDYAGIRLVIANGYQLLPIQRLAGWAGVLSIKQASRALCQFVAVVPGNVRAGSKNTMASPSAKMVRCPASCPGLSYLGHYDGSHRLLFISGFRPRWTFLTEMALAKLGRLLSNGGEYWLVRLHGNACGAGCGVH